MRIHPAWSPCEHQLTLALSPIWGPPPKPRRPEEVVYSPNDSCSHFAQRLFPPKLPQQYTCTIFSIRSLSFILIIHHIQTIFTSFYYETIILSFLQLLLAGRLLSVSCVLYSYQPFFLLLVLCEYPHGNSLWLPCPISQFSTIHTHFQFNMTFMHKHKTDYSKRLIVL